MKPRRYIDEENPPPSLAECYARARHTSDMTLRHRERCAVDYLIAAGTLESALGVQLWLLRGEFDVLRREVRPEGELNSAERMLVLAQLPSLFAAKQALWAAVWQGAEAAGMPQEDAANVAGRVLDAWLDPTCPPCEGRGYNGGTHRGDPKIKCRACSETGKRRTSIAHNQTERRFADRLLSRMNAEMMIAKATMRWLLSDETEDSQRAGG